MEVEEAVMAQGGRERVAVEGRVLAANAVMARAPAEVEDALAAKMVDPLATW